MRINILKFLFLGLSIPLSAQYSFKEHYFERNSLQSNTKNYVAFEGQYQLNSTTLKNQFTNKLLKSEFIDEEIKDVQLKTLQQNNTLGITLGGTLSYKTRYNGFNLTSSVGTHYISNSAFSKDFFKLALYGNSPYKGERLILNNLEVYNFLFNKLTLGAEKRLNDYIFLGASLNLYQSLNYQSAKLKTVNLLTYPNADQIDLDIDGEYLNSNGNKNFGAGLDFYLTSKYKKGMFILHVTDVGAIRHKSIQQLKVDTNIAFRGVQLDNILEINSDSSALNPQLNDYLNIDTTYINKYQLLPATITVGMQEHIGSKWLMEFYLNHRIIPGYSPQAIVRPNYLFNSNLSIAPVWQIGGFGKSDFGLNISYHHNRLFAVLDIFELENLLLKENSSGRMIFFKSGLMF